jgi:voltage-gated potassium channel
MREKIHDIIFEAETPAGKVFDITLLVLIFLSLVAVSLESVETLHHEWAGWFAAIEWGFTVLFTIELALRLYCVQKPFKYLFSFFGLVDILAILPTYLSLVVGGGSSLLVVRGFRLLRVFRLFKLGHYVGEAEVLLQAIRSSRFKITVFLVAVLSLAMTVGAAMYLIEGRENGFTSIPRSVYWAIVTMTTVGYGDISPNTPAGQFLASIVMIMGYGIIAVPTGIVSVEIAEAYRRAPNNTETCSHCMTEGHSPDANFCRVCGEKI